MTEKEKYEQVRKEAKATGWSLFALIVFWVLAGFGASQLDICVLHLPLWVITSSIGTWMVAIGIAKFLTTFVFKDMSLEEDEKRG